MVVLGGICLYLLCSYNLDTQIKVLLRTWFLFHSHCGRSQERICILLVGSSWLPPKVAFSGRPTCKQNIPGGYTSCFLSGGLSSDFRCGFLVNLQIDLDRNHRKFGRLNHLQPGKLSVKAAYRRAIVWLAFYKTDCRLTRVLGTSALINSIFSDNDSV